tara:strand:- start:1093 stop:1386 length:294 start_codon:yes stop_codon:yes gene_type:complete
MSSTERKAVEVGNVYAIVGDDKLQAVEVEFNDNLKGTDAAVTVLNTLNASLHNAGWVANSVMRVAQRDAQVQRDGDQDGDNMVANDEGKEGGIPVAG